MKARRAVKAASSPRRLAGHDVRAPLLKRCVATTRFGQPCQSPPLRGKDRCAFHTPGRAVVCGQRGGKRRAVFDPEKLEELPTPQEATDYLRLVAKTLIDVRTARLDTKTAQAIFYGCGVGRSLLELVNLDARVRALEGRQEELRQARNRGPVR